MNWKVYIFLLLLPIESFAHGINHHHVTPKPKERSVAELIQAYSATGQDQLVEQAKQQLQIDKTSANVAAQDWLNAAWVAQAEHKFTDALAYLNNAVELAPRNAQAWLLIAAIHNVQSNRSDANNACRQIASIGLPMVSLVCQASNSQSKTQAQRSLKVIQPIAGQFADSELEPWVFSIMADLAVKSNENDLANQYFSQSLALRDNVQVRATYANALIKQSRFKDALAIIPENATAPALATARLRAEKYLGHNIQSMVAIMDKTFKEWLDNGDLAHAREMATFYLEVKPDIALALWLANENVKVQREQEDLDLLYRIKSKLAS